MVPEDTDGYVSLTPSGKNLPLTDNHRFDRVNDITGLFRQAGWNEPDNFSRLVQEIRDISPLELGKHIITLQNATPAQNQFFATELQKDGSKVVVTYRTGHGTAVKPTTNTNTRMVSPDAVANNLGGANPAEDIEDAYNLTKFAAIVMGYVADNTYFDAAGKLQQNNTSGAQGYGFLPVGGVGNYVNHLPSSTQVNGLPGAMALASFVPINLNPWMPMREGSVGQTGGGAFVLSNAPSVAKYCADSNYLVNEVQKQLDIMRAKNMQLSTASQNKVKNLLAKLQTAESSLCKTYALLDSFINSTGVDENGAPINNIMGPNVKGAEIEQLEARKQQLGEEKRKLAVKALSTVLTLQDIVTNAVRRAMGKTGPAPKIADDDAKRAAAAPGYALPTKIGMGAI